jgi:hypothetical protein
MVIITECRIELHQSKNEYAENANRILVIFSYFKVKSCVMDINGFKRAVSKSVVKNVIVGIGIFLFGVFIAWLVIPGTDSEMKDMTIAGFIVIWALAGCCLFFGFLITLQHIRHHIKMKKGNHPIVIALETGNNDHLVWIYEHVTSVQGGGSDHQIWTYDKNGAKFVMSLKAKRINKVIKYLQEQFPEAVFGYTEEIRISMSEKLGEKL